MKTIFRFAQAAPTPAVSMPDLHRMGMPKVLPIALEAGNSPQITFTNYRAFVTSAEARRWFSILPKISLKQGVD